MVVVVVAAEEQTATDLDSLRCAQFFILYFFYIAIVQGGTRQATASRRCCRDGSRLSLDSLVWWLREWRQLVATDISIGSD